MEKENQFEYDYELLAEESKYEESEPNKYEEAKNWEK